MGFGEFSKWKRTFGETGSKKCVSLAELIEIFKEVRGTSHGKAKEIAG